MKLQGVSVIFALIVLPLILVLTYYIQLQVDTLQMQKEYDKHLLDSTYGAMSAFEINTANEDLSTVSDSLRTIIEASTNVFFTTLATNLGMSNASKSMLEPKIPSILYTLYDGYYISSPTRTPTVLTDSAGNAVSVGDVGVLVAGTGFSFKEVHTNIEAQKNCTDCIYDPINLKYSGGSENHVVYDDYTAMNNTQKAALQIKYDQLPNKEAYGQLLYLKKKANPSDPDVYTTNIEEAEHTIKHILKSYMPYSAKYKVGNEIDISVVYTLDNFVTIEGTINDIYYTKSGYLIPADKIVVEPAELLTYNQNDAKAYIEAGNTVKVKFKDSKTDPAATSTEISSDAGETTYKTAQQKQTRIDALNTRYDKASIYLAQIINNGISTVDVATINTFLSEIPAEDNYDFSAYSDVVDKLQYVMDKVTDEINILQYELDEMSAVTYYVNAEIFSKWVKDNLNGVEERHLVEISGQNYKVIKGQEQLTHDFDTTAKVFNTVGSSTSTKKVLDGILEVDTDSSFYNHKLNVIRDSIQYNLNLAMSTYNQMSISSEDYAMPVMENEEWEKILNNVSIVSFMQGYSCGLKQYSNYKIVSSTNNEISVLPEETYYVEKDKFSDLATEYHRIDCPILYATYLNNPIDFRSFVSKEVKYDKIYDKVNMQIPYEYDHKNYACYDCINDTNYARIKLFDTNDDNYTDYSNLRKAFYIGVGKERNNLYKMNAVKDSQGFEVIYDDPGNISGTASKLSLGQIKAIEIVFDTVKTRLSSEGSLYYFVYAKLDTGLTLLSDTEHIITPNKSNKSTVTVSVKPEINSSKKIGINDLVFENRDPDTSVYYEDDAGNEPYKDIADWNEKHTAILKESIKYIRVIYR